MPWRATIVQICNAYSEGSLGLVLMQRFGSTLVQGTHTIDRGWQADR
jgi:hypothetical protein